MGILSDIFGFLTFLTDDNAYIDNAKDWGDCVWRVMPDTTRTLASSRMKKMTDGIILRTSCHVPKRTNYVSRDIFA